METTFAPSRSVFTSLAYFDHVSTSKVVNDKGSYLTGEHKNLVFAAGNKELDYSTAKLAGSSSYCND